MVLSPDCSLETPRGLLNTAAQALHQAREFRVSGAGPGERHFLNSECDLNNVGQGVRTEEPAWVLGGRWVKGLGRDH